LGPVLEVVELWMSGGTGRSSWIAVADQQPWRGFKEDGQRCLLQLRKKPAITLARVLALPRGSGRRQGSRRRCVRRLKPTTLVRRWGLHQDAADMRILRTMAFARDRLVVRAGAAAATLIMMREERHMGREL